MSKKKKKPLMAMVSSAYFKIYTKNFLTFRKGAIGKSRYACRKYPGYVSVFGWEATRMHRLHLLMALIFCATEKITHNFRTCRYKRKIEWFNKEDWLPCLVSKYRTRDFECTVENFSGVFSIGATASLKLPIRE